MLSKQKKLQTILLLPMIAAIFLIGWSFMTFRLPMKGAKRVAEPTAT